MITNDSVKEEGQKIFEFLCEQGFAKILHSLTAPHIVGGALIDGVLGRTARDYDIVYDRGSGNLDDLCREVGELQENYFGGRKVITPNGVSVDLFRVHRMPPAHVIGTTGRPVAEAYVAMVPLNIDQIAYNIRDVTAVSEGCVEAFNTGVVRISCPPNVMACWPEDTTRNRLQAKAQKYGLQIEEAQNNYKEAVEKERDKGFWQRLFV